tara:strand:- start:86 stop:397 length:312 start_codon:yes stop_codon:yes gene_type:complete
MTTAPQITIPLTQKAYGEGFYYGSDKDVTIKIEDTDCRSGSFSIVIEQDGQAYISGLGTVISNHAQTETNTITLRVGDLVNLNGRAFTLESMPNRRGYYVLTN